MGVLVIPALAPGQPESKHGAEQKDEKSRSGMRHMGGSLRSFEAEEGHQWRQVAQLNDVFP